MERSPAMLVYEGRIAAFGFWAEAEKPAIAVRTSSDLRMGYVIRPP